MRPLLSFLLLALGSVFSAASGANDFPTQSRVEFVLRCMNERGAARYDTLYACVCTADKIAAEISHEEYIEAESYGNLLNFAGERGGVFRDAPNSRDKVKAYQKKRQNAEQACFLPDKEKS